MRRITIFLLLALLLPPCFAQEGQRIVTGAEQIELYLPLLQQKNTAIVANQASLVGNQHLVDTLLSLGANIKLIFCPEHGFRGDAEAGAPIRNGIDVRSSLPIISLYGKTKKPPLDLLQQYGIDLILFDLQDVGCRFYTYISTLHYVMEAAAEQGCTCLVLDRPNPNAHYVDGPVLEKEFQSFVGMHPVPIVYGMTIGEYAQMINGEYWLSDSMQCNLHVIPLQNYTHDSSYHLPIMPSPNLRNDHAIALYPSLCLFEGTRISVGRGTGTPFELIGAPDYYTASAGSRVATIFSLHRRVLITDFTPRSIKGVSDNPPFKGQVCHGLDLSQEPVNDCFDLSYLMEMYRHTPQESFFLKNNFFDKLAGTDRLRKQLIDGASEEEIRASWEPQLSQFKRIRQQYLLYP